MDPVSLAQILDEARQRVESVTDPESAADLFERVLRAASQEQAVLDALRGVPAGRALLRFTDANAAFEFAAGEGTLSLQRAEKRGPGPKVDAAAATWLGLMAGTLKPWLAFTRGLVVCRGGLAELRWLQQVAERIQSGYAAAR